MLHRLASRGFAGAAAAGARHALAPLPLLSSAAVAGGASARALGVGRPLLATTTRGFAAAAAGGDDKVVVVEDLKAFEKETSGAERCIAYFTATWCPPCRTISPVYASLSTKHPGVTFVKVDVDANEEAASKSNIRTIPAFYFYRKGKLINKLVGADQKKLLEQIEDLQETP